MSAGMIAGTFQAKGYQLLHEFAGGAGDGANPHFTQLVEDGDTLYGMTQYGGDTDRGTIFKMNSDGSGFTLLHEFEGDTYDGQYPLGSLTLDGSTLYGMTQYGGDSDRGTIFKVDTNGGKFTLLHEFAGGENDGSEPRNSLTLDGSTLYGMTRNGGDSNNGTIFKIGTDGSGYSLLHEFAGGASDGSQPWGNLTLDGASLYGMTRWGGDADLGTIFKIDTDGTDFALLREFVGGPDDGGHPIAINLRHNSLIIR